MNVAIRCNDKLIKLSDVNQSPSFKFSTGNKLLNFKFRHFCIFKDGLIKFCRFDEIL